MSTNDTIKPAILPAAEIDQYKATLADFDAAPPGSEEQDGIAYDCTVALRALLGHVDALAAGAVDAEALGRKVCEIRDAMMTRMFAGYPGRGTVDKEIAKIDAAIGLALHAIGYAAGRSEGEAEHEAVRSDLARQVLDQANELNGLDVRMSDARADIASLTAELAEARKERERIEGIALAASMAPTMGDAAHILRAIRARGEGRQG